MITGKIVAAALKLNHDGSVITLPQPARHKDLMIPAMQSGAKMGEWTDGFVTEEGIFYARVDALDIAKASGQVKPDFDEVLKTEDLW